MSDMKQDITDSMSSLMRVSRYVGLSVNKEKLSICNLNMTRNIQNDEDKSDWELDGISFQQVQDLKYLGSV